MIILLGFRASGDPEVDDCQYQLTDKEAWKVVSLVEPGVSRRVNPLVYVTIYSEDLTSENCNDNLQEARGAISRQADQSELF